MHYLVLVITNDDPEELLRPFDEELEDEPHMVLNHEQLVKHMKDLAENNPKIVKLQGDPVEAAEWWYKDYRADFIKDGELWSTYNRNSKWDWYSYGGRFADAFDEHYDWEAAKYYDSLKVDFIKPDFVPAAVLTPDGEWHEPGQMGWFDVNATEEEQKKFYDECYEKYIKPYTGHDCYLVDCHI